MGNSTVKACKALCFSLQIYLQDPLFQTYKKISKISQMGQFLRRNEVSIANLKEVVSNAIEKS